MTEYNAEDRLLEMFKVNSLDEVLDAVAGLLYTVNEYDAAIKSMAIVSIGIYNGTVMALQLPMGYHTVERLQELKSALADVPSYMNTFISQARIEEQKRESEDGNQTNAEG